MRQHLVPIILVGLSLPFIGGMIYQEQQRPTPLPTLTVKQLSYFIAGLPPASKNNPGIKVSSLPQFAYAGQTFRVCIKTLNVRATLVGWTSKLHVRSVENISPSEACKVFRAGKPGQGYITFAVGTAYGAAYGRARIPIIAESRHPG